MSRNILTLAGVAAVGGAGYYLYTAGGNTDKAQKHFQQDVSALTQKAKDEDKSAQNMGAKLDNELKKAKDQVSGYSKDATARLEDARKSTGNELMKGVDKFDSTVEKGASQAKSGISSWFGGK